MRLSAFEIREALLNPSFKINPPGSPRAPIVSTASSLRKAIRVYHSSGSADEARTSLDQSLSNYFSRPGRPATQAMHARDNLARYIHLAMQDTRPSYVPTGRSYVDFGQDRIAADCDVILLDDSGYEGRVVLQGPVPLLGAETLEVLAYPASLALSNEFDSERVVGIEIWELRNSRITHIPATRALGRAADFSALLDRIRPAEQ